MRYLLDTQIIIWFYDKLAILPDHLRNIIKDAQNDIYVSVISMWEIALKQNIGKLEMNYSLIELLETVNKGANIYLPLKDEHIKIYKDLPIKKNHNDPFDRMLIATAIAEDLQFITADKNIHRYKEITSLCK
jgi:PIN domain nuclease of toxin-antitoxin system